LDRSLKKTGYGYVDWIHLAQDREQRLVVNMVMSQISIKSQEPLFQLRDY
jgi:hypothetical protein